MDDRAALGQPRLTVVSGEPDCELQHIAQIITHSVMVDGRLELEVLLGRLLAEVDRSAFIAPKTLDLIGHTRTSASLLALGDWVIDVENPGTAAFFRELADHAVLPRLGVRALRLLGCNSAGTAQARATIGKLGELLGLEVFGASQLLYAAHYGAGGFLDCWSFLLVGTRELGADARDTGAAPAGDPYPRVLDVDALPAVVLGSPAGLFPRCIADAQAARQILQLVRQRDGARMPDLLTTPSCELALPAAAPGGYHIAHVLLDGEFVRLYPDGMATEGIVFPVDDAHALRRVVATLRPDPRLIH
jgi:hypothetical protein